MASKDVVTYKTKHSLLPDTNQNRQVKIGRPPLLQEPSLPCPATFAPRSRWRKSASFGASLVRHSSSQNDLEKDEGGLKGAAEKDGFEVHEFESSGKQSRRVNI